MTSKNKSFVADLAAGMEPTATTPVDRPSRLGVGVLGSRTNRLADLASGAVVDIPQELVDPARCRIWERHNRDYAALNEEQTAQAATRCENNPAWNLPMVAGAIAVAYNVEGVDNLTLTPAVTAKIFDGQITKWNDPEIVALNPDATLPDATIARYQRSDGSGTTQNFTAWLDQASGGVWTYGEGKEWKAPGGQGSKGNDGVASSLKSTPNSIGYIEESFLEQAGALPAIIDNGGGAVELTTETASNAIGEAEVIGEGNDLRLQLNYATTAADAYPIVLVAYEITCSVGLPANELALVQSFLEFTASPVAQEILPEIGYVPLPEELRSQVETAVQALS